MKKLIAASLFMAGIVFATGLSAPVQSQSPAPDLKPTFISPTPGLYVNGWPAFTVSYPKEWVERPGVRSAVFSVGISRPSLPPAPLLVVGVQTSPLFLEDWAKIWMGFFMTTGTDIKVLSDKPSQLSDGTPAREVEVEWLMTTAPGVGNIKNGLKRRFFVLMTKKDLTWIWIVLMDDEKIGEDLKSYAYSLTFLPGREDPVNVPSDVRAFLDMWCVDLMGHDVNTMMGHFSDRFLFGGASKPIMEQGFRNDPGLQRGLTSCEATVTVFEPRGEKTFVDGFVLSKARGDGTTLKAPMTFQQIINEHGQWKWYGNQK
jgi:hypothetical protein